MGFGCAVEPCGTEELPRPAARPSYSVLDITQTERTLSGLPTWEDALGEVLAEHLGLPSDGDSGDGSGWPRHGKRGWRWGVDRLTGGACPLLGRRNSFYVDS